MAPNVLSSKVTIHASIIVVRTFIRMRTMLAEHGELKRRLQDPPSVKIDRHTYYYEAEKRSRFGGRSPQR